MLSSTLSTLYSNRSEQVGSLPALQISISFPALPIFSHQAITTFHRLTQNHLHTSAFKMHSSIFLTLLSFLALSHTVPLPQSDDNPVDVVSNSVSPLSANSAGSSNSDTGLLDGSTISLSPRTDYNPVDVVSNSVSPLSANSAGNSNSNTGVLDGADIDVKRDAQSDPADVVSNSLSPLSDNVAGNNNENTGTLDGNTVEVAPQIDPTVNV